MVAEDGNIFVNIHYILKIPFVLNIAACHLLKLHVFKMTSSQRKLYYNAQKQQLNNYYNSHMFPLGTVSDVDSCGQFTCDNV